MDWAEYKTHPKKKQEKKTRKDYKFSKPNLEEKKQEKKQGSHACIAPSILDKKIQEFVWEKYPEESSTAFEAFQAYRDMGVDRSISAVVKILKKNYSGIYKFFKQWDWVNRADQWDRYLDQKKQEQSEDQIAAMKFRQIEAAKKFWSLVDLELAKFLKSSETNKELMYLTPDQMCRLADFASKLERLNLDEPSEIISVQEQHRSQVQKLFFDKGAQSAIDLLLQKIEE